MNAPTVSLDPRFDALVQADVGLRKLADGCIWAEGPVWLPDRDALIWSDVRSNREWIWSESGGAAVYREPSNHANGHTLDPQGRLLTCEHSTNSVTRTERDGTIVTLAESYMGNRLNSPNDIAAKSDGSIWFTDPPYGIVNPAEGDPRESEIGANYVFRLEPDTGEIGVVANDFDRPNGIAFSPDEKTVYISDTGAPRHMRALDVREEGSLANSRVFAVVDPPASDGFRVDTAGNVWTSAGDGVHVFAPDGTLLGKIMVPEKVANCEFGGPTRQTLFITASTSLYAIDLLAAGACRP